MNARALTVEGCSFVTGISSFNAPFRESRERNFMSRTTGVGTRNCYLACLPALFISLMSKPSRKLCILQYI